MPTLPTPTTWRTTSTGVNRSNNVRRSSWRVSLYSPSRWSTMSCCSSSSIVTRSGGSAVIRGRPRAIVVSLAKAPRLVRFVLPFSTWTLTWPRSAGSKKFMNRSTCMLAYQMSISGMVAKVCIRER